MKPLQNTFSIVAVGAWNPAIFHGQWITEYLLDNRSSKITISVSSNPNDPPQIEFEEVRVYPSHTRLQIAATQPTRLGMQAVVRVYQKIASLLEHTPIQSVGLNFGFVQDTENSKISSWIGSDNAIVETPSEYVLEAVQVSRQLRKENEFALNLSVQRHNDGPIVFSFNYDFGTENVKERMKELDFPSVGDRYDEAIYFCDQVFGIKMEEQLDD